MSNLIFILLSLIIIISAIMIISSKNPVHSILFLVLVFVNVTILLLMLNVEFIAMLFLVVYVGAISVLFLFVVMMLNVKIVEFNERFIRYIPIGGFIGLIFFTEIFYLINNNLTFSNISLVEMYIDNTLTLILHSNDLTYTNYLDIFSLTNIEQIGNLLYTKYIYLFIIAGLILFVAMISAIILTLVHKVNKKTQSYYFQNWRLISNSISLKK